MTTEQKPPLPKLYIAKELVDQLGDNMQKRRTVPDLAFPSLPMLNDLSFGLPRRKLIVIGARPSHGKTAFMSQLAVDLAFGGAKVLILSYEESVEQLLERAFCNLYRVDNRHLQRGRFNEYTEQYLKFSKDIFKLPLVMTDCAGKSCKDLGDLIEQMPANARPDVIFVDYLQAIKGLGSLQQGTERSTLDEYIKYFRAMCVYYNIAGVLMSQINRSTEIGRQKDVGPKIHQLKGTGFLEEHPDMIMLLHWLYKTTGKKADYNRVWVDVAKNKSGETGKRLLHFEPEYYRYSDAKTQEIDENVDKSRERRGEVPDEPVIDKEAERVKNLFGGTFVKQESKGRSRRGKNKDD